MLKFSQFIAEGSRIDTNVIPKSIKKEIYGWIKPDGKFVTNRGINTKPKNKDGSYVYNLQGWSPNEPRHNEWHRDSAKRHGFASDTSALKAGWAKIALIGGGLVQPGKPLTPLQKMKLAQIQHLNPKDEIEVIDPNPQGDVEDDQWPYHFNPKNRGVADRLRPKTHSTSALYSSLSKYLTTSGNPKNSYHRSSGIKPLKSLLKV